MTHDAASALSVRRYGAAPGRHTHEHFQILWALDGRLELDVEGHGAVLTAGQGRVLRPGERHDFESRSGSRCLVLDTFDAQWQAAARQPRHAPALHHLANCLAAALDDGPPLLSTLGPLLLAQAWGHDTAGRTAARRALDWAALTAWLQAHLAQPLTAADLAARVHLGESQFRERCRQEMGSSPMQWLRQLRLARAQALRAAGRSVAQAARQSGYESPSALTAALRRAQTGASRR